MAAELFADGFDGEHGDRELCDAWFSHAGFVGSFAILISSISILVPREPFHSNILAENG